jgi:hypothetical protein
MGVSGQRPAQAALPPVMTWYPLYRRLGRPQGQFGRVLKISPPPRLDLRTVQLVTSRYNDYAIPLALRATRVFNAGIITAGYWTGSSFI